MWVYRPVLCARCLLCSPHSDGSAWCSQSTCLMMHKVSVPPSPQHTHTHTPTHTHTHTHSSPSALWFACPHVLPSSSSEEHTHSTTPVRPPPLFHFHSWRPWCVISHKLTMPRIGYLSRSPSPRWACHDNQYFSEKHAGIYSLFFLLHSQWLSVSLSLKSKRAFLY